jgi:hypothetical protein
VLFKRIIFFVQIFDGKNHAGGHYERYFRDFIIDLLNGDDPHWGTLAWPRFPELNLPSAVECEGACTAFLIRLRAYVDGFLQTGIDSSGIETPSSRRVRASADEAPIMTVSADERAVVIFDEIYESWRRNQPRPLLNGDGTMAISVNRPRWENQDPKQFARDTATYYFQELLSSPLCHRISKCSNPTCKRYFLRRRIRKTGIKRGSYCGSCKLIAGAQRTRASRQRLKQEMLQVAVKAWQEWDKHARRADRAVWVANRVNAAFGKARFIHPKWVTQNRTLIESLSCSP